MSEQFSRAPQEDSRSDRLSVVRVWALVLLAVLAGGAVFLRGRRLVDNIIPVSADSVSPTELQRDE